MESRAKFSALLDRAGMLLVLVLLFAACALKVPNFLGSENLSGLLLSVSSVGIVACTMLFCLASGNFDLSVGTVAAAAGILCALVMEKTHSIPLGVASGLALGLGVGLLNGSVVALCKINPLITTLATMQMVRGLALLLHDGTAVGIPDERFYVLGQGQLALNVAGVSITLAYPVFICLAFFLIFGILLHCTVFGRNTMAIGGNENAARLAGVPVERTKISIFALQGLVAGFGGIITASQISMGDPKPSDGFELSVISACVLGGVSLTGGVGSMGFVIAGVFIMGIVENAMNLLNMPTFYQYVARGAILLAAVLFDRYKQRR